MTAHLMAHTDCFAAGIARRYPFVFYYCSNYLLLLLYGSLTQVHPATAPTLTNDITAL
jgi:hypothetical protein